MNNQKQSAEGGLGDVDQGFILESYHRLLADVRILSGVHLDIPDEIAYSWVLTIAPKLDKAVLAYLEEGTIPCDITESRACLLLDMFPLWLRPLLEEFLLTGKPFLLRLLRTALQFVYKVEHEPTSEQISDAVLAFEQTEEACALWDSVHIGHYPECHVLSLARKTVAYTIGKCNWRKLVPRHGPGGVFPTFDHYDRTNFTNIYETIEEYFPFFDYFCMLPSFISEVIQSKGWQDSPPSRNIVAKFQAVPKDSRGPRIICVHPRESVWIQLGLARVLEDAITRSPLTGGRINFTDQTVNGLLALSASADQQYCTIDLREASDRMSRGLVNLLFGDYTSSILSCCRASHIAMPDDRVLELKKWAPMGNGLTFPVQSLVFWSLVRAGIECVHGVKTTDIFVFGDDIIVPSKFYDGAIRGLVSAGLVPNQNKTFRLGFFRESCGVDAFKGVVVTPLRMKKGSVSSLNYIVSNLDLAKRLRQGGYEQCASYIYSCCRSALRNMRSRKFPKGIYLPLCNNAWSAGLYEYINVDLAHLMRREPRLKFSRDYHTWGSRVLLVRARLDARPKHDWYHVQDSLLAIGNSDGCTERGTEYAIPYRTRPSYGWTDCIY
jgi:hypothetical protein